MIRTIAYNIAKLGAMLLLPVFMISCSSTRKSGNKYLLLKNTIDCKEKNIDTDDLWPFIKQKPNRKVLGVFRFHSGIYSLANRWKENKTTYWMKNTVGEEPIFVDTILTLKTIEQFEIYLASKGYFNAEVSKDIQYKNRSKKAKIEYIIDAKEPYTIRNIDYTIKDSNLVSYIFKDTTNSLLKSGINYDVEKLDDERERISSFMKNDGFYGFSKEFISYSADSALNNNQIDIYLTVNKIRRRHPVIQDSISTENHKRYTLDSIFIYPEFNPEKTSEDELDTLVYQPFSDDSTYKYYFITYTGSQKIKPKIIAQSVFYKPEDYYQIRDVNRSYRRLSDLKVFRFSNIQFEPQDDSTNFNSRLNSSIQLTRSAINAINVELEGTHSSGDLGIATNLILQNKNTFKGAEILNIKVNGAMEVQHVMDGDESQNVIKGLPFNTLESGVNAGLDIPKFLLPVRAEKFAKRNLPITKINAGFNYQKRPDYERTISNLNFGYSWRESTTKRHTFYPIEFSSVDILPDSSFLSKLQLIKDERLLSSYTNHLTPASAYTFEYNSQKVNKLEDFIYFRTKFESAGYLNTIKNDLIKAIKTEEDNYTLFGIRYSQYLRIDLELRYYRIFNEANTVVTRLHSGVGYAYGNSEIMPFEKSFYAGGANGIRAWKIRSLGPGSYDDENNFDKTGDIIIEANLEYRYRLYDFIYGATFIDAGNIWLMRVSEEYVGGVFRFDRFLADVAVGGGMGLRFDFSFFVFRLDAAIPLRNPKEQINERWIDEKTQLNDINFNIGIGYPF